MRSASSSTRSVHTVSIFGNLGCAARCRPGGLPVFPGTGSPGVFEPVKRHRGEPGHTRDRHQNLTNQPQNQPHPPTHAPDHTRTPGHTRRPTPHHSPASAVVVTVMATAPGRGSSEGVFYPVKRHRGEPGHTRDTRDTRYSTVPGTGKKTLNRTVSTRPARMRSTVPVHTKCSTRRSRRHAFSASQCERPRSPHAVCTKGVVCTKGDSAAPLHKRPAHHRHARPTR